VTGIGTDRLLDEARAVLERNWTGSVTRPGRHLYPHQWSWDSAFVAIGNAPLNPPRARIELRSLFAGQWRNGLLPHIVFTPGMGDSAYFPSPSRWETERSPDAPREPRTSGVVQPPVHATAVWRVHQAAPDEGFLRELAGPLAAWHDYLHRARDLEGDGLVAIHHPWESGMDNSPAWDAALAAIAVPPGGVPPYPRIDLAHAPDAERPSVLDYEQYLYLVEELKARDYDEARIRADFPFAVADPLFNAALVRADEDLARIVEALGEDGERLRARAARTAAAMEARLWDEERGLYAALDLRTGRRGEAHAAGGLVPLFAGVPAPERAARLVEAAASERFWPPGGHPLASWDRLDPAFDRRRYWRGPAWSNLDWLVGAGLRRAGEDALAVRLDAALLALVAQAGFREYFDPDTGTGYGSRDFSWTAALVADLLSGARPAS
jgi:glycogen debranching enzyme